MSDPAFVFFGEPECVRECSEGDLPFVPLFRLLYINCHVLGTGRGRVGDWVDTIATLICIRFGTISSISHQPKQRIAELAFLYLFSLHSFPTREQGGSRGGLKGNK